MDDLNDIDNTPDMENLLRISYKSGNIVKLDGEMKIAVIEFIVDSIVIGRGNQELYTAQTFYILAAIENSRITTINYMTVIMNYLKRNMILMLIIVFNI